MGNDVLTREGAAAFLNRTPGTLANWASIGIGPPFERDVGGRAYYSRAKLEQWRDETTTKVRFEPEPPARRRKSLAVAAVPTKPADVSPEVPAVDVMYLSGKALQLDGPAIWEPVDLAVLTVLEMLGRYVDIALIGDGDSRATYGVQVLATGRDLDSYPAGSLLHVGGRLARIDCMADNGTVGPDSAELRSALAACRTLGDGKG